MLGMFAEHLQPTPELSDPLEAQWLPLCPAAGRQLRETPQEKEIFIPFPHGKGTGRTCGLLTSALAV